MHFFNPVPLMALVEVISGLATDAAVAATVYATAAAWGKNPVHAKSTPGFIVNRVARPYYAEALRLLHEQAADAATIDAVMRDCGGFRMGPFELMDLIGHDVNFSVTQSVFNAYFNDPRFTPSVLQQEMVNAGFLGRKSGAAFIHMATLRCRCAAAFRRSRRQRRRSPSLNMSATRWSRRHPRFDAAGTSVLTRAPARIRRRRHASQVACSRRCGRRRSAGLPLQRRRRVPDRRPQRHPARPRQQPCPNTVLFDLVLDFGQGHPHRAGKADQCSEEAWQSAVGLFQAAGFTSRAWTTCPAWP
jgi:3-hydroxybutyryl-CoA dehydrogenase